MSYTLQLKQVFAVKNIKPAVINVYDYYQTSTLSSQSLTDLAEFTIEHDLINCMFLFQVIRLRRPTRLLVSDFVSLSVTLFSTGCKICDLIKLLYTLSSFVPHL